VIEFTLSSSATLDDQGMTVPEHTISPPPALADIEDEIIHIGPSIDNVDTLPASWKTLLQKIHHVDRTAEVSRSSDVYIPLLTSVAFK
jgi:hypothetical protein